MKKSNNQKKGLVLSILGIIGLIIITSGVTYAFFNYAKQGTTENSVTTGTITFLYTEVSGVGRGISIDDAYPVSDAVGKVQTGEGKVFDFKVTSDTPSNANIPYEVTARKKENSTLDESAVKLYLTKVTGDIEKEVLLDNYSNLIQTTKVEASKYIEKTIFQGKVPANSSNYEQAFRLRMWIDDEIDFSPVQGEEGNDIYPYNDKTFTVTVNVYANAKVVTDEEIALESNTNISSLSVGETNLVPVTDQDYDYETSLPGGTTSTTINIETENPNATVNVEKMDSLAYSNNSSIKRLSTAKILELNPGDNYFKVTVTSENKEVRNEYKIKVNVGESVIIFGQKFNVIQAEPTLTTSSNNTSDASGLYKSTETNSGNPTYYFRGNVENNYVSFAGFTWRIIRINEDGTIRMIMANGINSNATYQFNSSYNNYSYMYYTNSNAKTQLESWYKTNITDKGYSDNVETGNYFCEQAKTKYDSSWTSGSATMTIYSSYTPNFKCSTDGNGKGIVNANIGLINYDEVVYAGGYYSKSNSSYYLYNNTQFWTMSSSGFSGTGAYPWIVFSTGLLASWTTNTYNTIRPVINLRSDVTATGSGISTDPYVVQ